MRPHRKLPKNIIVDLSAAATEPFFCNLIISSEILFCIKCELINPDPSHFAIMSPLKHNVQVIFELHVPHVPREVLSSPVKKLALDRQRTNFKE